MVPLKRALTALSPGRFRQPTGQLPQGRGHCTRGRRAIGGRVVRL